MLAIIFPCDTHTPISLHVPSLLPLFFKELGLFIYLMILISIIIKSFDNLVIERSKVRGTVEKEGCTIIMLFTSISYKINILVQVQALTQLHSPNTFILSFVFCFFIYFYLLFFFFGGRMAVKEAIAQEYRI